MRYHRCQCCYQTYESPSSPHYLRAYAYEMSLWIEPTALTILAIEATLEALA